MRQGGEDHVVVVLIQALLVLGAIDGTQADVNADACEVFVDPAAVDPLGLECGLQ